MTAARTRRIRRVLVAFDTSPGATAAAAAAARLAAVLEAELAGLFVEDHLLVRLGEAPHAHQIEHHTDSAQPVSGQEIERQLRAQAKRARRALAALAAREGVVFSFRVCRGAVAPELLAAAEEEDLLTVGRSGWSHGPPRRLGSTARALLERRPGLVLLLERESRVAPPPGVVFDGSEEAVEALALARRLARPIPGGLVVLPTDTRAAEEAVRLLAESSRHARVEEPVTTSAALIAAVRARRIGLLVLPVGERGFGTSVVPELLCELRCPVLVVR